MSYGVQALSLIPDWSFLFRTYPHSVLFARVLLIAWGSYLIYAVLMLGHKMTWLLTLISIVFYLLLFILYIFSLEFESLQNFCATLHRLITTPIFAVVVFLAFKFQYKYV